MSGPRPAVSGATTTGESTFDRLAALARERSYFFSEVWTRSREEFGPDWVAEVVDNVSRLFGPSEGEGWDRAIGGYAEFALDAMRNQKFFEQHGRYRYSTLSEIEGRFYRSEEHMMRNYLPGMFLSHYLWPHHHRLLRFFRSEVVPAIQPPPGLFFDVGIGTGMYSREVLRAFPDVRGRGFDISEHSARFTRDVLRAFGSLDRYDVVLGDIFTADLPQAEADLIVSQECLEHLEDPERLTRILLGLAKPGALGYITAAINAAHSDHIYLFRSPEEVHALLERVGWTVVKTRAEYAYGDHPIDKTPCVAGFLCRR